MVSIRWLCLSPLLLITLLSLPVCQCFTVLAIFPHMGMSHWLFFRPFVTELVRRGHNVTLLSYFGIDEVELRGQQNYHEYLFKRDAILTNTFDLQHYTPSFYKALFMSPGHLSNWGREACDLMINNEKINEILANREDRFDLLLAESFHTDCALALAYQLNNIPVVGLSSSALMPQFYHRFGLPDTPSFIPSEFVGFAEKMPLVQRVVNFAVTKSMLVYFDWYQTRPDNKILRRKFGSNFPDLRSLAKNMSLMLVNSHFAIAGARPYTPNVVDVAGVHVIGRRSKMGLEESLQQLLDRSTQGVILMSFGSTVRLSTLPVEKRKMLMRVFGQLEQTVIMKWENKSAVVENQPENVHLLDWLPQREILSHRNVKVFFSHGGMMGTLEALVNSVPVLGTPIFGDQYLNVALVDSRRAGVRLNYVDWTEEWLLAAIQRCLSEEYQENARLMANYLAQQDPLEVGVNAIENVVATKGLHWARPYSVEMSWITYYSIDAIFILLSPLLITIITAVVILKTKKEEKSSKTKRD